MIAGDLNARTKIEKDYVMDDGDNFSPINDIDGYTFDNPLSRNNMDTAPVDTHGEKVLELCKACSIRIVNGRLNRDLGNFTRFQQELVTTPVLLTVF